jgi:hypothetical protein
MSIHSKRKTSWMVLAVFATSIEGNRTDLIPTYSNRILSDNVSEAFSLRIRCLALFVLAMAYMVTRYALDGPGIESRWGEIFGLSSPPPRPHQSTVQWVLGLSRV